MELHILFELMSAVVYGFLGRLHGGGFSKTPRWLRNLLWAAPLSILAAYKLIIAGITLPFVIIGWAFAFAVCWLGKTTGHGNFMDLGTWAKSQKDEALEFVIKPLENKLSQYWYDFIGLSLIGFAAVSGPALVIALVDPVSAAIVSVSGILKGLAYAIGRLFPVKMSNVNFDEPTEIGETLTGAAVGLGAATAAML